MLVRFHGASARKRRADETQAYGIELARRQLRSRVARPEAVPVVASLQLARAVSRRPAGIHREFTALAASWHRTHQLWLSGQPASNRQQARCNHRQRHARLLPRSRQPHSPGRTFTVACIDDGDGPLRS